MAKIPSKDINWGINSVQLEDELSSIEMRVSQETPEVNGFSSTGPERVEGNYDWEMSGEGFFDGAASQGDATLFALIGNGAAVASTFDPTGNPAGPNDPNYDGNVLLSEYGIRGATGQPVTYSFRCPGAGALSRNVA